MTINFFTSTNIGFFTSANISFFASTDLSVSKNLSASVNSSAFVYLIISSLSTGPLLLIVLDINRFFHIGQLVTSVDDTTVIKILKSTI